MSVADMLVEALLGRPPTAKQQIRRCQDEIRRDCRKLTRQMAQMEKEERLLRIQAEKELRKGNVRAGKAKLRNMTRTRTMIDRFAELNANMQGVAQQVGMIGAISSMQHALKTCARCMMRMNGQVSIPAMHNVMREFTRQQEMMTMKEEMMNDAMEGLDDGEEDIDERAENVYQEIMDVIASEQLRDAPRVPRTVSPGMSPPINTESGQNRVDKK